MNGVGVDVSQDRAAEFSRAILASIETESRTEADQLAAMCGAIVVAASIGTEAMQRENFMALVGEVWDGMTIATLAANTPGGVGEA